MDDNLSDDEINPKAHKRLLEAVSNLGKTQHIKKPTRNEPTLTQDEFHLVKSTAATVGKVKDAAISVNDLVNVLNKNSKHLEVGKELRITKNKKVLQKPLERPVAEKIQRVIGYEKTKKNLARWDAVVARNRVSEHQVFPLEYEEIHADIPTTKKSPKPGLSIKSQLMIEMEAIEAKLRELKKTTSTNDEKENEKKLQQRLAREELIARRKELAYLRTKESQQSAKARKQNKIKSKKYHKFLKREKLKEQMKEFELLQKVNPEAALEKLEQIEKNRVLERTSLRHKNTGTWAKNLQVRAKYDKDVQKDLAEQLALSRELTQKKSDEENETEEEDDVENEKEFEDDGDVDPFNPWIKNTNKKGKRNEVADFVSDYRKYWLERNKNEEDLKNYKQDQNGDSNGLIKNGKANIADSDSDSEVEISNFKNIIKATSENITKNILKNKQKTKKSSKIRKGKVKEVIENGWVVEAYDNSHNNVEKSENDSDSSDSSPKDIDDIFDKAEDLVQEKVANKIKTLSQVFNNQEMANKPNKKTSNAGHNKKHLDLNFKPQAKRPEFDEELIQTPGNVPEQQIPNEAISSDVMKKLEDMPNKREEAIDPNKFVEVKPKTLRTALPDMVNTGDFLDDFDEDAANAEKQLIISEAFQDDDIVADFEKERDEERKKNSTNEVDLTLPGWGSWAGCGISTNNQRKRFVLKFPKEEKRRDDNKEKVVIYENESKKLKEHLVSDLPFPFTRVQDYEASIRAPIGRSFVPETAFRLLTRPAVVTKMGKIINPMSDDILIKAPKRPRNPVDARINEMGKKKKS